MANIYLHIEIKKREFEAKFFTGLKAALRGHKVLVGYLLPLLRRDLLAPGIFHDKALTPRPKKIASMAAARAAGHHYTSIDEEHGLLRESYDMFANLRYSAETLEQASAVMFWGPHDYGHMKKAYPQFQDKFHMTGNPRADLWRPDFAPVYDVKLPVKKPYILFVSNLGSVFGEEHLPDLISKMRNGYFHGPDDEREFHFYRHFAHGALLGAQYIRSIRRLALGFPNVTVVVRPHPVERPEIWRTLIGAFPNVLVSGEGSVSPWLRNAAAIVHNGCTTALEAVKCGTPVITYASVEGYSDDFFFPNKLGMIVRTHDELARAVSKVLDSGTAGPAGDHPSLLLERLVDTGSETAADRMISVWENLDTQHMTSEKGFWREGTVPQFKSIESFFDVYRFAKYVPKKMLGARRVPGYPKKFEILTEEELSELKERFGRYDSSFRSLRVRLVGPRMCVIEA